MYNGESTREQRMETLFLKGCAEPLTELMQKAVDTCCEGCQCRSLSQMNHAHLYDPYFRHLTSYHLNKAAPLMVTKMDEVMKEMVRIARESPVEDGFRELTMLDCLDFFTEEFQMPPLARISTDDSWKERLGIYVGLATQSQSFGDLPIADGDSMDTLILDNSDDDDNENDTAPPTDVQESQHSP